MAATKVARRKPQVPAEDTAAFGPIAERFRRAGDLERAVSLCRDGLQKFPDTVSARVTLGWALLELGKFDEARTELESVLRRAPDNLSAIRGLAELHDRAEHTMDLPMDGPGQWPPDAEALDQLDQAGDAAAVSGIVDESVWTPGGANEAEVPGGVASGPTGPAYIAPPEMGLAMWSAVEPEPAAAPASGMSSIREIDPNAGMVAFMPAEEPVAVGAEPELDLAALIAEADSLEAVAEVIEPVEPAVVLDTAVDLQAFEEPYLTAPAELTAGQDSTVELSAGFDEEVDLAAAYDAPVELTAGVDAVVEPELVSPAALVQPDAEPELIVAPTVVESAEVAEIAEVTEAVAAYEAAIEPSEPAFVLTAPDEFTPSWSLAELASAEASVDGGETEMHTLPAQFAQAFDFETVPEPVAEVVAPVVAEVVAPIVAEIVAEVVPEVIAQVVAEVDQAVAPVLAEVVAFAKVAEPVRQERPRSPVPALERFLAGVHARRRQLMAESVA